MSKDDDLFYGKEEKSDLKVSTFALILLVAFLSFCGCLVGRQAPTDSPMILAWICSIIGSGALIAVMECIRDNLYPGEKESWLPYADTTEMWMPVCFAIMVGTFILCACFIHGWVMILYPIQLSLGAILYLHVLQPPKIQQPKKETKPEPDDIIIPVVEFPSQRITIMNSSDIGCPHCGEKRLTKDIYTGRLTFLCGYSKLAQVTMRHYRWYSITQCQGQKYESFVNEVLLPHAQDYTTQKPTITKRKGKR